MKAHATQNLTEPPSSEPTKRTTLYTLLVLGLALPTLAAARFGDLDPTFGAGGKVLVHFTSYVGERGHSVLIQSSGRILLGGNSNYGDVVAGLNPDGTLDSTFGSGGKLYQYTQGFSSAMVLAADDKFIMAGGSVLPGTSKQCFYMRRYDRNGIPDAAFGSGGAAATDMGDRAFALDAIAQPDGKIVLVGLSELGGNADFGVARYHPDGSLDTSFGSSGTVRTDLGKQWDRCSGVALQPDGKIVVAGYSETSADDARFAIVRYLTNGVLDASFDGDGKVTSSFGFASEGFGVAVQPDGKILMCGWVNLQLALVRYNPNGTLDTTFGPAGTGLVTRRVGSWDAWIKVGAQPDAKILAIGQTATTGRLIVARYNPDGRPDPDFGTNGIALAALGSESSEAAAMALQRDGKLLVAGGAWTRSNPYSDVALARFENDGAEPPVVVCPSTSAVECSQPAEVTALVHNASGLPLAIVWTLNGQIALTNSMPATNGPTDAIVSFSAELPLGTNSVGISVTDSLNHSDACTTEVIVVDRTPPSLLSAKATPGTLWPPNNQMVPVQINALATDQCGDTHWKIVGVLSNEPPGKPGHRAVRPDWLITGDHTLELRATRNGWGTGRVYSILLQAMDAAGNLSQTQIVTVAVSKSAHSRPQPATLELE